MDSIDFFSLLHVRSLWYSCHIAMALSVIFSPFDFRFLLDTLIRDTTDYYPSFPNYAPRLYCVARARYQSEQRLSEQGYSASLSNFIDNTFQSVVAVVHVNYRFLAAELPRWSIQTDVGRP